MTNATLLGHLGLFVRRGFLSPESCRQIRCEMAAAGRMQAMVRPLGANDGIVDEETRRTHIATVSTSTSATVGEQLRGVTPALEEYFQVRTSGWQTLQFFIYEPGHFFLPHRDVDPTDPSTPDWIKARQVSVSIVLNDPQSNDDEGRYGGGEMVFYGRRGDRSGAAFGITVESEEGLFIAFRSDWIHEVKPVSSGRRYSIVTWLT